MKKMTIGMLWYDKNKDSTLEEKIEAAAAYYQLKYGEPADQCFVNPAHLKKRENLAGLAVKPSKTVLKNHFWLGKKGR
jgi:hypothetical protein